MTKLPKTKKAIMDIGMLCQCVICSKLPVNPFFFKSACEHLICAKCVPLVSNLICPKCGVKTTSCPEELKDHNILNLLGQFSTKLLHFADVTNANDVQGTLTRTRHKQITSKESASFDLTPPPARKRLLSRVQATSPALHSGGTGKPKSATPPPVELQENEIKIGVESPAVGISKKQPDVVLSDHKRRNAKGETPLHVACIMGNLARVKSLVAKGAEINSLDNARWTPLHEAATNGSTEIARFLLESGALVNFPSGQDNITPLHDAVQHGFIDIVKVMLQFGADVAARDIHGKTPKDYAVSKNMKAALSETFPGMKPQQPMQNLPMPPKSTRMIVFGASLSKELRRQLKAVAAELKLKISTTFSDEVTHVVVETDDTVCKPTNFLFRGLLLGRCIISANWISQCLDQKSMIDPLQFEVSGTPNFPTSNAPRRSRENAESKLPPLFNGCSIYLRQLGTCADYSASGLTLSKADISQLIKAGGGTVLGREPRSDGNFKELAPYHASPTGSLSSCSQFIIYQEGDVNIKYNMTHMKALPVEWLFTCIERFSIVDPEQGGKH